MKFSDDEEKLLLYILESPTKVRRQFQPKSGYIGTILQVFVTKSKTFSFVLEFLSSMKVVFVLGDEKQGVLGGWDLE